MTSLTLILNSGRGRLSFLLPDKHLLSVEKSTGVNELYLDLVVE